MLKIVNSLNAASFLDASEHEQFLSQCVSTNAIKVIERLKKSKFHAYLVGGAVRDMLLGETPKDFDVATNATPEEIRKLFKNSRIIGRRFQIVHIRFGREIIEVTTFRGSHKSESDKPNSKNVKVSKEGLLLRDNVFGTIEEDAERRDFTANGLYYDVKAAKIFDFLGGIEDIKQKQLKLIGDPESRFNEDPVRLLRAIRFAAKLNFSIESAVTDIIDHKSALLGNVSNARLFDESLKLYISGYGQRTFALLEQHNLTERLLFNAEVFEKDSVERQLAELALINTDKRLKQGKSITPAFIYAVFLWPSVLDHMAVHEANGTPQMPAFHQAATEVLAHQCILTAIPKRFQTTMREMWEMQFRLPHHEGKKAQKIAEHPRFRAAYDFLLLREAAGEIPKGLGDFWTAYQEKNPLPEKSYKDRDNADKKGYHQKHRRKRPRN